MKPETIVKRPPGDVDLGHWQSAATQVRLRLSGSDVRVQRTLARSSCQPECQWLFVVASCARTSGALTSLPTAKRADRDSPAAGEYAASRGAE
jgi:hypothetical protein